MYEVNLFKNDVDETTYEFKTRFKSLAILLGRVGEFFLNRHTWTVVVYNVKTNQVIF